MDRHDSGGGIDSKAGGNAWLDAYGAWEYARMCMILCDNYPYRAKCGKIPSRC